MVAIPRGLTVRIAGFHPAGPGSTPGVGNNLLWAPLLFGSLSCTTVWEVVVSL